MSTDVVMSVSPLSFPWQTLDPFLFCVYHDDHYPAGNEAMGPKASLAGRDIGMDFEGKDGWRMYHGATVPGFPQHPHRGFETVTIVRRGLVDHSDSLGAAARFGHGDVQWLTAGKGILHSEMFPLLEKEQENPLELFQIWLNLPGVDKLAQPHFSMLWSAHIPRVETPGVQITLIAGALENAKAPPPPPKSWAARADTDVQIWTLKLAPNATFTLPAAAAGSKRVLYYFKGRSLHVGDRLVQKGNAITLRAEHAAALDNGNEESELLMLQGRPIGEPVAQHGPFVMNTRAELVQTFEEYQRTQFGGWPWKSDDPTHAREETRFARHADGRIDRP